MLNDQQYTYADYRTWDDGERWELIDGVPYAMAPAPSETHQSVTGELFRQISNFLKEKPCKVFIAPFDVRLNAQKGDNTVVQPDVIIVCDKSKLDGKGVIGAPDFVAEVLSPSTAKKDMDIKYTAYLNAGVKEYWIIDPYNKVLMAHTLTNSNYERKPYFINDSDVPIQSLSGFTVNLTEIFNSIES